MNLYIQYSRAERSIGLVPVRFMVFSCDVWDSLWMPTELCCTKSSWSVMTSSKRSVDVVSTCAKVPPSRTAHSSKRQNHTDSSAERRKQIFFSPLTGRRTTEHSHFNQCGPLYRLLIGLGIYPKCPHDANIKST